MEELDGGSWVCRARFSHMSFPRLDTLKLSETLLSTEQQWNLYKSSLDLKLKDPRSLSETTSFRPGSNASPSSATTSSNDLDQELKNLNLDSSESKPTTSRKTDPDSRKSNLFLNRNERRRSRGGNRRSVSPFFFVWSRWPLRKTETCTNLDGANKDMAHAHMSTETIHIQPLSNTDLSDTFKEKNRSHEKRLFSLPLKQHKSQNKSVSKDDLVQHATMRVTSPSSMEKLKRQQGE